MNKKLSIGIGELIVAIPLAVFSSWTLAYHIVLLARVPSVCIIYFFLPLLVSGLFLLYKTCLLDLEKSLASIKKNSLLIIVLFSISLAVSLLPLFILRPNSDDIDYFHRAFLQVYHLNEPIFTCETLHDIYGLPPLSVLHLTTSYEYFASFLSLLIPVNPVFIYHNVLPAIISFLVPIVYFLLYRSFGFKNIYALLAVVAVLLFLLVDGNSEKSFGNFAFTRIWQGKSIVFTLLIPTMFFITNRFLNSKALFYFILIVMAGISGVGLSNAAVYLCPALVVCIALAHAINECIANRCIYTGKTIILILVAGSGTLYCMVFILAILVGILPMPTDVTAWTTLWPNNWLDNIRMVIDSKSEFLRDACILFCLPWLNHKNAKMLFCFSLLLILIFFNPITGPIWVKVVMPGSYWRLVYLMPLPFCVGLIVLLLDFVGAKQGRVLKQTGIFVAIILLIVLTVQDTVLSPRWVVYKSPLEYQFASNDIFFSRAIVSQVNSRKILAIEEIAVVLPFLDHSIKLETTRWGATYHMFSNAGLRTEGLRRLKAWEMVATGKRDADIDDAMKQSISNGVDAIITRKEFVKTIMTFLSEQSSGWESSYKDGNYALLVRAVSRK